MQPERVKIPSQHRNHHEWLADIARRAMLERHLAPDFPPEALLELRQIAGPASAGGSALRDLCDLLWCSIDNDDSRDLDQLSVAEELPAGAVKLLVAVADVDALVCKDSALDRHARQNTTSVYTAGGIFPMLPERLSTDLTSLNQGERREAMVIEWIVREDGSVEGETLYRARVENRAKLAYDSVAAWLDGKGPRPEPVAKLPGMEEQLRVQDRVAQRLRARRLAQGALDFETLQPRAGFKDGAVVALARDARNRAKELIEELMVEANGVSARFLSARKIPSLRRVVRSPERWDRIVSFVGERGTTLPHEPDSAALERFLAASHAADPLRFPDLSLAIVKMMGRGEYVVDPMLRPVGAAALGHFGLAVHDYTHSTAPNRRFPDLLTHRLLKSALEGAKPAYDAAALATLATHCTDQEDAATKVERQLRKCAAALLLERRIGERFDALVTGASDKGCWVRCLEPPIEGKLVHGHEGLDLGHRLRVKLVSVEVERGFIDFERA